MHYLVISPIGLFVYDQEKELKKHVIFPKNVEKIADLLIKKDGPEIKELQKEFEHLTIEQPNEATHVFRENFRELALKYKFIKNENELNKILNEILIEKTQREISKIERRDKLIVQTVSALNDLDKILNVMSERIREWYGLHYPELEDSDHERFVSNIVKHGNRENFKGFIKSMGMELTEEDIIMLQNYAKRLKELYDMKKELTKYLEKIVPEEIPNINALLGSLLAARLLSIAGSLKRLAKMPSSTIQLLGAEKNLFKFLKGREVKRPPKFGILFLHPDISGSRKELQGKIARLLSSRLTLAARTDYYTKVDRSEEILKDYKEKLEKIK